MTSEHKLKKPDKKPEILILGKGYIGIALLFGLWERPAYIISAADVNYHDPITFRRWVLGNGIQTVINASGFTGRPNVDQAETEKELCWKLNVQSPIQINRTCDDLGIRYIHISSGCIYNGYNKEFMEEDKPNFGMFDYSSYYSKTKHEFELLSSDFDNKILRVRMPVSGINEPRNYLSKLLKYDNLINFRNSKTYIPDLCKFVDALLDTKNWVGQDIYNVVNPNPLNVSEIMKVFVKNNLVNPKWKIIPLDKLDTLAPRSNCVLDSTKVQTIYKMRDEMDVIEESVASMYDYINSERN
jgi:dTDP-4-dehydrorhamnose reductase